MTEKKGGMTEKKGGMTEKKAGMIEKIRLNLKYYHYILNNF